MNTFPFDYPCIYYPYVIVKLSEQELSRHEDTGIILNIKIHIKIFVKVPAGKKN
jgi:hypothetical protein